MKFFEISNFKKNNNIWTYNLFKNLIDFSLLMSVYIIHSKEIQYARLYTFTNTNSQKFKAWQIREFTIGQC